MENCHHGLRLPRQLRDQLLHDLEIYTVRALVDDELKSKALPDIFLTCALTANLIYGSVVTRFWLFSHIFVLAMKNFMEFSILMSTISSIRIN